MSSEPGKRIPIKKQGLPAIEDELAYTKNKCAPNARKRRSILKREGQCYRIV
jgi:hypothetical protein